jgi:hypothetical protein
LESRTIHDIAELIVISGCSRPDSSFASIKLPDSVLSKPMAKTYGGGYSRANRPDLVTEELAAVLSDKTSFEFKALFVIVYANLRARKSVGGGEEMLRLRVYEKLQDLVNRGAVEKIMTKVGKEYRGCASLSSALPVISPEPALAA